MNLQSASHRDARRIAEVYRQAFPASVQLFFSQKDPDELLDLLELSFTLPFYWGAKGVLYLDQANQVQGYCLYSTSSGKRQLSKTLSLLTRLARKLSFKELAKLAQNQFLMTTSVRRTKKVPKPQARILSIAVLPTYQGKGVGTVLLNDVLHKLQNESIGLNVRADNTVAKRLYASSGFTEYGTITDLSGTWLMLVRESTQS
ncbi:MAG: GNAT family N-acetyltransferase [Firmicutes bacterium]|jgi:ribosomal protein S18 acetylase RimI-like enzyme|nr:GNAT family N-acetyltransferase [Bacillota bacterium]